MSDDGIDWDAEARRALSDQPIPSDEHAVKWYRDNFSLPKEGLLLDFGCSLGKWISLWWNLGYTPVGIDQSIFALKLAKEKHPETEFIRCMGQNLPFKDEVFDVVVSVAVFQHNRNMTKRRFLQEIRLVLKSNGYLLFTESTERGVDENWTNDRYFSREGWVKFVLAQGFRQVTYVEPAPWYLFSRHFESMENHLEKITRG